MNKKINTSTRLKEIMNKQNLKQVDILKKAKPYCQKYDVKLERNDLSQYVSGKTEPGQKKLMVLAEALNVSPSWLMGLDVPMEKELPPYPSHYYDIYDENHHLTTNKDNKVLSEKEKELAMLKDVLRKKGFLDENENLSEENFNMLIEFAKANKQFIMKDNNKE